jgi:hypothetical protein
MDKKNNPRIEHADLHSDEPLFVLLGRDPQAADLVRLWAEGRDFLNGSDDPKIAAALTCADAMAQWCKQTTGSEPVSALTLLPFEWLAAELRRRGATVDPCNYDAELGDGDDLGL